MLTFQETHRAVEALWAEFVITERSQQLADEYVHLLREVEGPHVAKEQSHAVSPLIVHALLQSSLREVQLGTTAEDGRYIRNIGIRIFLQRVDESFAICSLKRLQTSRDQGASACPSDTKYPAYGERILLDKAAARTFCQSCWAIPLLPDILPVRSVDNIYSKNYALTYLFILPILDRVLFKCLVCHALQIIHQWLRCNRVKYLVLSS